MDNRHRPQNPLPEESPFTQGVRRRIREHLSDLDPTAHSRELYHNDLTRLSEADLEEAVRGPGVSTEQVATVLAIRRVTAKWQLPVGARWPRPVAWDRYEADDQRRWAIQGLSVSLSPEHLIALDRILSDATHPEAEVIHQELAEPIQRARQARTRTHDQKAWHIPWVEGEGGYEIRRPDDGERPTRPTERVVRRWDATLGGVPVSIIRLHEAHCDPVMYRAYRDLDAGGPCLVAKAKGFAEAEWKLVKQFAAAYPRRGLPAPALPAPSLGDSA